MIAALLWVLQQHGAHVQHAQPFGDRFLMTPEIVLIQRMEHACFQTCELEERNGFRLDRRDKGDRIVVFIWLFVLTIFIEEVERVHGLPQHRIPFHDFVTDYLEVGV